MADPLSMALMAGMAGMTAGSMFSKGSTGPNMPSPLPNPTASAPPPDQSQPAQVPGSKPAPKTSQQQSFLSGAAALRGAGSGIGGNTGSSGGKSLLGQ